MTRPPVMQAVPPVPLSYPLPTGTVGHLGKNHPSDTAPSLRALAQQVLLRHSRQIEEAGISESIPQHQELPVSLSSPSLSEVYYKEYYEERTAILQFDGSLSREEAERRAFQESLEIFMRHNHPMLLIEFKSILSNGSTLGGG